MHAGVRGSSVLLDCPIPGRTRKQGSNPTELGGAGLSVARQKLDSRTQCVNGLLNEHADPTHPDSVNRVREVEKARVLVLCSIVKQRGSGAGPALLRVIPRSPVRAGGRPSRLPVAAGAP